MKKLPHDGCRVFNRQPETHLNVYFSATVNIFKRNATKFLRRFITIGGAVIYY